MKSIVVATVFIGLSGVCYGQRMVTPSVSPSVGAGAGAGAASATAVKAAPIAPAAAGAGGGSGGTVSEPVHAHTPHCEEKQVRICPQDRPCYYKTVKDC